MLNAREIQDWLVLHLAELLSISPDTIDIHDPFSNYGLSSRDAVTLSGDLEELLGRRLSPTLVYEYPSISMVSGYLAGNTGMNKSSSIGNSPDISSEPIAVIGMGCRFPGAKDPKAFWQLLIDGVDTISEIPADRWEKNAFYNPDPSVPGKAISYWGGFLDNIDLFDPFFFGISPIEAKYMDPQQRLLLELAYEALDDAGKINANRAASKTGVFIGISINEYSHLQLGDPLMITSHSGTGSALSIAANRISYYFNFQGPSMAIDTACSSSLAAVHLACQSLRNGECRMALAGGVNMILSPAHSIAFTKAGVLAPDGRCKTFDARANGYVRGEGGAVIVLKPLSIALADGDPVHALILGSAMCQDGRTNGLMAPSREAQEAMLREAYHKAGISPGTVQYIETHGTGTLLGDSIEAKAIGAVIGADRSNGPCVIGSVKTNIGHLEAAAGIAGLIKVILSLKHGKIPPSLHFQSPNPHIVFDELHLRVPSEISSLSSEYGPALAGVSSFGFGGTNVHAVLSAAGKIPEDEKHGELIHSTDYDCHLLPLSANSFENLQSLANTFQDLLNTDSSASTKDICYAAGLRRSQFDYRLAVIGISRTELCNSLQAFLRKQQNPNLILGTVDQDKQPKLAFVFPGQGGQWYGMGRELLKKEPVFYKVIEQIHHIIKGEFGWSLMDLLYADPSEARFDEIDVVQPALFAIQVALAELWQSWGIRPDAIVGHSMGEVAAAHVAGILSLEDAIRVICCRSHSLKHLRGLGSMMATELSVDQAKHLLKEYDNKITIAAINSPTSTVLSGDPETMKDVMDSLQQQNLFCKLINVDVASHSQQMDQVRPELLKALEGLHPRPASIPIYSTVTGARGDDLTFNAEYWMDNLRKPVLFSDAIEQLLNSRHTIFIEIGSHPILLSSIQQSLQHNHQEVRLFPSLLREQPEKETMLGTLGKLYTEGYSIAWDKLYPTGGKYVYFPPIPWQRQRYWIDTRASSSKNPGYPSRLHDENSHPLLGDRMNLANAPSSFVWQTALDNERLNFLEDHRIDDEILFPAAAFIEMALQAAVETGLNNSMVLSDFVFKERLILQSGGTSFIQALLSPDEKGNYLFSIYSRTTQQGNWILHASVTFLQDQVDQGLVESFMTSPDMIRQQSSRQHTSAEFYQVLLERGMQYGACFRGVEYIWSKANESLGRIRLPESPLYENSAYQIHPAILDACLQVLAATQGVSAERDLYVPTGCKRIRFFRRPEKLIWSHVSLQSPPTPGKEIIIADIRLYDEDNRIVAELIGFNLQRKHKRIRHLLSSQDSWLYQLSWQAHMGATASLSTIREKRHWLIFADDEGLGEKLAQQLEDAGDSCHLLLCNKAIRTLDKHDDEAFLELIEKHLKDTPSSLYGVIHLWSLSIPQSSPDVLENSEMMQMLGCNSILLLLQVLARRLAGMPRLWLVTRGAQSVKAGEPIALEQSALWGFGKVISFEFPELQCIRIDLDRYQSNAEAAPLLFKQISIDDREDQIAFRAGVRFVLRLQQFNHSTLSGSPAISFVADCTYMITGGLGGLGLTIAKWMIHRGAHNLILLGRNQPSAAAMSIVEEMRNEGAEVFIEQADVSDGAQMEQVFEKMGQNMPALRGIVHAAGVLDDGALLNLDIARMKNVMAPKVKGTWNLHKATLNMPLDFFVLFSSVASVLGSPGQGNYAAASSYLDAMAYYRRNMGLPAISINWGPWADVGLAAEVTERLKEENASTQHLIKVIKIDQGLKIFEQLLTEPTPQVIVLPFDLSNLLALYPTASSMPFFAEVVGNDTYSPCLYARPKLRQQYVAPRSDIERKLAALWRQTLHIDQVGVHDSFFELGGDSVLAAQILSLAQKTFGIRINPQDAFKAFTIERLAEMLEAALFRKIEEMSETEAQSRLSMHN